MKVHELISELQKLGQNAEVHAEVNDYEGEEVHTGVSLPVIGTMQWDKTERESPVELVLDHANRSGDAGVYALRLPKCPSTERFWENNAELVKATERLMGIEDDESFSGRKISVVEDSETGRLAVLLTENGKQVKAFLVEHLVHEAHSLQTWLFFGKGY